MPPEIGRLSTADLNMEIKEILHIFKRNNINRDEREKGILHSFSKNLMINVN